MLEEQHEHFAAAVRKREILAAIKVKMSGSVKEVKVNRNMNDISSIKRVTRKFMEVSRCSRAKQQQRNVQKRCTARAKLLFCLDLLLFSLVVAFAAEGDVTRDDSQRQLLVQHSVAMLEQCRNYSKQCRNNVATLCCAKNRRCESSRVTSPLALHDFIFCLSKLQMLSRASPLALAKSIYYRGLSLLNYRGSLHRGSNGVETSHKRLPPVI